MGLFEETYNPDVLSCIANLSNDEVFTPPELVNQMLDMLPEELWSDPNATFLDPATKSGVFLREIAKRLIKGLEDEIPCLEERLEHIYKNQIFGIAITELTSLLSRRSLYCSKFPHSEYSVVRFDNPKGNIDYVKLDHTWENGRCKYCGAAEREYSRDEALEQYAYEFIHLDRPEQVFPMKFDVIIGNPPYQLSDGGAQASATPIYHLFVEQAKKLNPRYLSLIIPARWYSGGRGLDDFRHEMLNDKRIRVLHDYLNASSCFGKGIEIKGGVCYFLWDRDHLGMCQITTHNDADVVIQDPRYLKEEGSDFFIRYAEGISIYKKVKAFKEAVFSPLVSAQRPFGLRTFVKGRNEEKPGDILLYQRGGTAFIEREAITQNKEWVEKWKVYISRAYGADEGYPHQILGKPLIGEPGSCCTETYVTVGPFDDATTAENVAAYMRTKFFRFMVSLIKVSQMAPGKVYACAPVQDFSKSWTDEELYAKYGLSDEEVNFIESMIKPMDLGDANA